MGGSSLFTLKLGLFHPSLERALADDLRALARGHSFGRAAVVVPSQHMLSRVQEFLALEAGLTLVGVDFLTFHGLALRLFSESGGAGAPLVDSDFEAYAIGRLMAGVRRPDEDLGRPTRFPGLAHALCATVRDIREAQLDPEVALEAVGAGLFREEDAAPEEGEDDKLAALFRVAGAYDRLLDDLGVLDPAALARRAIAGVAASRYLASLRGLFYYGFYDLTDQQRELFAAAAKSYPVTAYIPCRRGLPAYAFSEAFVRSHLLGFAGKVEELEAAAENEGSPAAERRRLGAAAHGGALRGAEDRLFMAELAPAGVADAALTIDRGKMPLLPKHPPALEIWNTAGAEDEVWAVAKEIVGLLDAGMPADAIGVVGRSLGPYLEIVDAVFRQNAIPYWSPGGLPLMRSPAAKAVVQLLDVAASDFDRPAVLELLASPYLARDPWLPAGVEARADLWDLVSRRCGVRGGLAEWRRLVGARAGKPLVVLGEEDEPDDPRRLEVPSGQIDALLRGVEALAGALARIPERGRWGELADAARAAVSALLRLPDDADPRERAA
jgi:hypothetical protein